MAKWAVDQAHSSVEFQVRHMMISKVKGYFGSYTADITAADITDLTTASIAFTFDVNTISTKNGDRDNHLRSADFFDTEQYPEITFISTNIAGSDGAYKVTGDLTIRDITKPVTFDVKFNGKGTNPWGQEVYGFEATSSINREEFGLTWNANLETGGVLVGKDITVLVELEVSPEAEAA